MPISCCTSVALTARITHTANVLPCCFGVHVYELRTAAVLHVAARRQEQIVSDAEVPCFMHTISHMRIAGCIT